MEEIASRIAESRTLIGVFGIPGSGKSTFSNQLGQYLASIGYSCVVVPMDGFHYTKAQLDKFKDPEVAHARRGAEFTINAQGFADMVKDLKRGDPIKVPNFDHSVGDPIADAIDIPTSTQVIIVEGLYLNLNFEPWRSAAKLFDELVFIACEEEVAIQRLSLRHVQTGICQTKEDAFARATENDLPNGRFLLECQFRTPTITINTKS